MKSAIQIQSVTIKCPACPNIFTTDNFNFDYNPDNNRLEFYYISCHKCGADFTPLLVLDEFKKERKDER